MHSSSWPFYLLLQVKRLLPALGLKRRQCRRHGMGLLPVLSMASSTWQVAAHTVAHQTHPRGSTFLKSTIPAQTLGARWPRFPSPCMEVHLASFTENSM